MLLTGQKIANRYQVQELLRAGSIGSLYKGYDPENNKEVTFKVLQPEVTGKRIDDITRFTQEAETISRLNHNNLARVYAHGEHQGFYYIVTELLGDKTLYAILQKKEKLALDAVVEIITQVSEALKCAHAAGVVHRELRPENIFITEPPPQNGYDTPTNINASISTSTAIKTNSSIKVCGFGFAHLIELAQIKEIDDIIGFFSYMSPEQGGILQKPVDERSDLYSLGIIFYQLLTGELPFKGDNIATLLHQQIAQTPVLPRQIRNDIPEIVEKILLKLLKKDPEERYQTASGLLTDLGRLVKGEYINKLVPPPVYKRLSNKIELAKGKNIADNVQKKLVEKLGMSSMMQVGSLLSSIREPDTLLEKILEVSMQIAGTERGFLLLYPSYSVEGDSPEIKVSYSAGKENRIGNKSLINDIVVKKVQQTREAVIINDVSQEEDLASQSKEFADQIKSIIGLPLLARDSMLGILYMDSSLVGDLFSAEKTELLQAFSAQVSLLIENALLSKQLTNRAENGSNLSPFVDNNLKEEFLSLYNLTKREKEILRLLLERLSKPEIQQHLHISNNTLKTHVRHIYTKMLIKNSRDLRILIDEFIKTANVGCSLSKTGEPRQK